MENEKLTSKYSDQEELINRLQKELHLKTQCLSLIAHDFVGINRNIMWILDALEKGIITQEIFSNMLPELKSGTLTNQKTIDSTIAWVNSQRVDFIPNNIEIKSLTLFDSIRNNLTNEFQKKNIDFSYEGDHNQTIISDAVLINFILNKLVENAIKYSYDGGHIFFRIFPTSFNTINLIIEDNGMGMNEQVRKNLFTLNGSPYLGTANEKGAGFSLIVVKDIADLLGISIEIISSENNGTKIELIIPHT